MPDDVPINPGSPPPASAAANSMIGHLDQLKITNLHRRIYWSAGLGIFLDGYDLSIIAVVLLVLGKQWALTVADKSWLGTATIAGSFLGSLIGGHVADRFGRKAIYLIDILTFLFAAIMCGLAWSVASLVFFRLILGVGVGADYPLSATYLAEFLPTRKRGSVMVWVFALWMAGAVVSALVGWALLHAGPTAWRWMFITGAVPALSIVWLRRNLPESPRWYLLRGRAEEAAAVVRRLDPSLTDAEADRMIARERRKIEKPADISMLFTNRYIRLTLLATIPWFLMDVSGYAIGVYLPTILKSLGMSKEHAMLGNAAFGAISVIGIAALAATVDRIGRIGPQIWGFVGDAAGLGLVAFAAFRHSPSLYWVGAGIIVYQIANSYGPGNTTWMLPAELYPTEIRATGHGFATAFSRLGAVTSVFLLPRLTAALGLPAVMAILAASAVLGAITTAVFSVEPGQKALE